MPQMRLTCLTYVYRLLQKTQIESPQKSQFGLQFMAFLAINIKGEEVNMAKPIKETPILCGKDSQIFSEKIAQNKTKTASQEEYDRVMANYRKMKLKNKIEA
jgi:hypothetical protein